MLVWFVLAPIFIALLLYILSLKKAGSIIAVIVQTGLIVFAWKIFLLSKEGAIIVRVGDFGSILGITLKADTLSSVFVLVTSCVFLMAVLYNLNEKTGRLFWFLLFVWEGLLFGIFLSCDLFNIFVLIEVVTVVVAVFIMFKKDSRSMYDGMVYLMANTVAVQFYLFGVGYIYKLTGVLDMDSAALAIKSLDKSALVLPFALIMTSLSLKCALMPLFSWLPRAHGSPGAPTVVSAILSGLHIKTGVYLFIRFQSIFEGVFLHNFFLIAGIVTGIAGFMLALSQSDIKLILAYSTISQIGMIMIGLNLSDTYSFTGSLYHIINHTLFKSALFLNAGIIKSIYGTRNLHEISGVFKRAPLIGVSTIMAIMGITGTPFFNGSISKYFIMSAANWVITGIIIFLNLGTITLFIKYSSMLIGPCASASEKTGISVSKQIAVLALGISCLVGGIFGEQFILFLFSIDLRVDTASYLQKAVFFVLSVAAGFLLYKYFVKKSKLFMRIREIDLSFRGICVSIGAFFAILLLVFNFFA